MTQTLANARLLQQATEMMTLDGESPSKDAFQWTMRGTTEKATSISWRITSMRSSGEAI